MPKKNLTITDSELVLLTLLAEHPSHGYQLEQIIAERGMREWTRIGFSSIYSVLGKMTKRGWLTSELESVSGKGPARQVFNLTTNGKKIWLQAAYQALRTPRSTFTNFYLGLASLPALDPEQVLAAIREHQTRLQDDRRRVNEKLEGYGENLPWSVLQLFHYSLTKMDCELQWLENFLNEYQAQTMQH